MADVKKGTRIEGDEAARLDRGEMGVMISNKPPEPEVEGQAKYLELVMCPWCASVGWCELDTRRYTWFVCGTCGGAFKA